MAEPTIVPTPISDPAFGLIRLIALDASSGALEPAAMNVAPATSSERRNASQIFSREATKKSSHTMAMPRNMKKTPRMYATMPPFFSQSGVVPQDEPALNRRRPPAADASAPREPKKNVYGSEPSLYTTAVTAKTAKEMNRSWPLIVENKRRFGKKKILGRASVSHMRQRFGR